jgi:hypothetical protein
MGRFVVKKITAEDDENVEKCAKIQNKSNYYKFLIFIVYIILNIIMSFYK